MVLIYIYNGWCLCIANAKFVVAMDFAITKVKNLGSAIKFACSRVGVVATGGPSRAGFLAGFRDAFGAQSQKVVIVVRQIMGPSFLPKAKVPCEVCASHPVQRCHECVTHNPSRA